MYHSLIILLIAAAHGVFGASIEHVIPRATETTTLTHEGLKNDCTEKATLYIKHLDEYLATWEKEKGVNRTDAISHSFWFDLVTEVPFNLPPNYSDFAPLLEDFSVFTQLLEDRWMSPLKWLNFSFEQMLCAILDESTSSTTTKATTISLETMEPFDGCLLRTKAYIQYFKMFEHYEAWQRYKWVHVYGFNGEYASIEDYLWDDFLVDAPYDNPEFENMMELFRRLYKKKEISLLDDERLVEVLCVMQESHEYDFNRDYFF